jgi:menaquinone-dependent protoporphyrinogen oxidase
MKTEKSKKYAAERPSKALRALFCIVFTAALLITLPAAGHAYLEKPGDIIEKTCGDTNIGGKKILIAYDTRHGATSSIAGKIADALCAEGFQVDLKMARTVKDVSAYDAVIAGSPIYMFNWLPGTTNFLNKFKTALADKPVALFITCTYLKDDNDTPDRRAHAVELYIQPVMDKTGIEPISTGILSGEFQYSELYPLEFILMKLAKFEEGDFRNWDKIEAWAQEVGALVK